MALAVYALENMDSLVFLSPPKSFYKIPHERPWPFVLFRENCAQFLLAKRQYRRFIASDSRSAAATANAISFRVSTFSHRALLGTNPLLSNRYTRKRQNMARNQCLALRRSRYLVTAVSQKEECPMEDEYTIVLYLSFANSCYLQAKFHQRPSRNTVTPLPFPQYITMIAWLSSRREK